MSELAWEHTDTPTPEAIETVESGLRTYNQEAGGIDEARRVAIVVRDGDDVVAGLFGRTWGTVCEIQVVWVDDGHRGGGVGTRLMREAEEVARERGCDRVVLNTFSFQAPRFYERLGYESFAVVDGFPRDARRHHMQKRL